MLFEFHLYLVPAMIASHTFSLEVYSIFPRPGSYQQFPEATAYVVNDAPGYQIEFYPISSSDPQLMTGDCQVFGTPFSALQICIEKVDSHLIAGNISSLGL